MEEGWIKETYDPETIYQLDRFHIYKEIKKKIRDGVAQDQIREMLEQKKVDEMLEYIQIYADSIESDDAKDKGSEKARNCIDIFIITKKGFCLIRREG